MSGPVEPADRRCENERLEGVEAREGRRTSVGGLDVARVLPTKGRRTVGAWCFVDLMGPVGDVRVPLSSALVVPFAAGGPTDKIARDIAESLRKPLGQTIVVENVGGAGGTLRPARARAGPADG